MAARAAKKSNRTGRNAPCPCGSGKKYKECHQPIEQEYRKEQMLLRQAQDLLIPKIMEAAHALSEQFPAAFERFWDGKYQLDQLTETDTEENRGADRFLTWFAFDVRQPDGQTLVAQLAAAEDFAGDAYERQLLAQWRAVRLRAYVVTTIAKGQHVIVRELFEGAQIRLADSHASRRLSLGEVVVGHLAPVDTLAGADNPTYYLAGAAAQLTEDTAEQLLEFAELHLANLRRTSPEATWDDLLDQRSEVLNHFVMALPTVIPDPTVFEQVLNNARLSLQLTAASVADLLGRPHALSAGATRAEKVADDATDDATDATGAARSLEH